MRHIALAAQKKLVFVGMSGGVDSSVAALLLKRRGYQVVGVFMRCYNIDGCAERDAEDARRVAEHIGIPFYVWDFEEEYKRRVVDDMIEGYRAGRTPNPDVECNREIKFGMFFERAMMLGADHVATGHYVRLARRGRGVALMAAKDTNKDQSYFLWTLTQQQLTRCLFPIGDYLKPRVRDIARAAHLPTAEKKDSQGICFLGKVGIEDFLKQYLPSKKGTVVTTEGKHIGEHQGSWFYTIGQRHGLDLSEKNRALGIRGGGATRPHYVTAKDVKSNTVTVAEGDDHPALYKQDLELRGVNFLRPIPAAELKRGVTVMARVRYRQPVSEAVLRARTLRSSQHPSRIPNTKRFELSFMAPQKFVASGQSAVFYTVGGEVLGGGIIEI